MTLCNSVEKSKRILKLASVLVVPTTPLERNTKAWNFDVNDLAAIFNKAFGQTAKLIAADIERKRNAVIMAKFASRFKQRHEHMIFITWLANAKEQRHQRKIVKRFSQRLLNREKFMIYERWIEFVAEKKRIQNEEEKNRRLLDRFVKKFHRRTEHATLAQWIHFVEERKFERDEEKRQKYVMRRFINKVQQRDKMSIYDRWVAFVDDIKQERADDIERAKRRADEAEAERQEELRQERVLERFVRKFRKRVENAIFSTWSHKVRDKVAARKPPRLAERRRLPASWRDGAAPPRVETPPPRLV